MGKKADAALEILKSGGCFWVFDDKGFHGEPVVAHTLHDAQGRRVRGFGIQTMRELEQHLNKKQDKFGFEPGCYKISS